MNVLVVENVMEIVIVIIMDYRKDLLMKDVAWTNDPFRIRENPRVMAIDSAVEVDLTGQVCASCV